MATGQQQRVKPLVDAKKYTIGIVCALPKEADAVQASLDHHFKNSEECPPVTEGDRNYYTYGTLAKRYVVLARMGKDKQGGTESGDVASDMRHKFPNIKLCLLVGITAIIPHITENGKDYDGVMGDVIISKVVKPYDYGRDYPTGFQPKDTHPQATAGQARFSSWFESRANKRQLRARLLTHLLKLEQHPDMEDFHYPGYSMDRLYEADYVHEHRGTSQPVCPKCSKQKFCEEAAKLSCEKLECSKKHLVTDRKRLSELEAFKAAKGDGKSTILLKDLDEKALDKVVPLIFHGNIAAGNRVMKNGTLRDEMAIVHDVIGFEMEGVGIWQQFPTIVIKAGCDYGDSHKNKIWQEYASMTAAACAKGFLEELQMGIPQNVEYGEGFAGEGVAGSSPPAAGTFGGAAFISQPITNSIGNVDRSNFGVGTVNNAENMTIDMSSGGPKKRR